MSPEVARFFQGYAEAFNRSLRDREAVEAIQAHYTDCFVGAIPTACGAARTTKPSPMPYVRPMISTHRSAPGRWPCVASR